MLTSQGLAWVLLGMVAVAQDQPPTDRRCAEGDLTSVKESECRQFRICDGEGAWSVPMDCPPGTLFDPGEMKCDFRYLVQCTETRRQNSCMTGVTPRSGCRNFTICAFSRRFNIPCGKNLFYSSTYGVCVRNLLEEDRGFC